MREPSRCLLCLAPVEEGAGGYHAACSRRLFDAPVPPTLPYSWSDLNALAEQVVRRRVAVPGVQPKMSLHLERGSGRERLTLVGMEGDLILKPPVEAYPEIPELEHVTLRMADVMGIETAPGGLIALQDGRWAFISRRMDRDGSRKRHMEDMCQLTDRLTERKYSGSLEQVGRVFWRQCENPGWDALRFLELTIFCFLTGNADMHLKNFSLLYDPGGPVRLAPAYDLLPTALLLPEDRDETALTLNGRKRRLTRNDFLHLAQTLRLTEKQAGNLFARLSDRLDAALEVLGRGFCADDVKTQYAELIRRRAVRLGMA
jgi:serine/threonine-protein kinase HipA